MLNMNHYSMLENLLDGTFGRGSTNRSVHAIRHKTEMCGKTGDILIELRFECPVNFNPSEGLMSQRKELDKDSMKALTDKVANVKKQFKELSGVALTMKVMNEAEPEVVPFSMDRTLVRARYSRTISYSLSVPDGA